MIMDSEAKEKQKKKNQTKIRKRGKARQSWSSAAYFISQVKKWSQAQSKGRAMQ